MKKILLGLVLVAASAGSAHADEIAVFNFNDGNTAGTASAANTTALFAVDRGNGALTTTFNAANIVSFGGTTVGAQGGDAAGAALALQGGTGAMAGGTGGNNGGTLSLTTSTVGFSGISVSLAAQATGSGFSRDTFAYSTDGGTSFTDFAPTTGPAGGTTSGTTFTPPASFSATAAGAPAGTSGLTTFDLRSITALDNNANVVFRFTLNGATSSSGNIRIDNLAVTAVPEPTTIAMLLMGLGGVAGSKLKKKRKDSDESADALEPLAA